MDKEEKTPTREEDLARLEELRDEYVTSWEQAHRQLLELNEITLRAIEWWGKDRWLS